MSSPHQTIDDQDELCHWVFSPKYIDPTGSLIIQERVQFSSRNKYKVSVNSKNLCYDFPNQVHKLGQAQAIRLTERHTENGKHIVETYMGFLSVLAKNITVIKQDEHSFDVMHSPVQKDNDENLPENYAHCDIAMTFPETLSKPIKSRANYIRAQLFDAFGDNIEKP